MRRKLKCILLNERSQFGRLYTVLFLLSGKGKLGDSKRISGCQAVGGERDE